MSASSRNSRQPTVLAVCTKLLAAGARPALVSANPAPPLRLSPSPASGSAVVVVVALGVVLSVVLRVELRVELRVVLLVCLLVVVLCGVVLVVVLCLFLELAASNLSKTSW